MPTIVAVVIISTNLFAAVLNLAMAWRHYHARKQLQNTMHGLPVMANPVTANWPWPTTTPHAYDPTLHKLDDEEE